MYRQMKDVLDGKLVAGIWWIEKSASIPFDVGNKDYQQFKKDIESGVELQDPDENIMTPEEVSDFLKTLP